MSQTGWRVHVHAQNLEIIGCDGLISFVCFLLQQIPVIHECVYFNASWDSGLASLFNENVGTVLWLQMFEFLLHKLFSPYRWETSWSRRYLPALSCSCHRGGWKVSCFSLLALTTFVPLLHLEAVIPNDKFSTYRCATLNPGICQLQHKFGVNTKGCCPWTN